MPPVDREIPDRGFPPIAIPVYLGRVSPVLDTCTRLCIVDAVPGKGIRRKTVPVQGKTLLERAEEIKRHGAEAVICGAVSNVFYNLLKERYVDMICGITGEIGEVIRAHRKGTLSQGRFRMPGAV